jgi:hypothetical protein
MKPKMQRTAKTQILYKHVPLGKLSAILIEVKKLLAGSGI